MQLDWRQVVIRTKGLFVLSLHEFFGLNAQYELSSVNRILPMEGMRGFAALLVFFVHFHSIFEKYIPDENIIAPIRFMASIGHVGVDLFFVLSGFLVYGIVMRSRFRFIPYFSRRIQRLYPVFVVVLGIYILLSYLFPDHSKLPSNATNLIPYILANIAMLPGMIRITPIITVSWSLSYEWFFYLILPIAFAALGMRKWKFKWRIVFWIALVSAYWLAFSFGLTRFIHEAHRKQHCNAVLAPCKQDCGGDFRENGDQGPLKWARMDPRAISG